MSNLTATTADREVVVTPRAGRAVHPIPTSRIISVEMRKMFDTRSGFWLLTSIGVLSVVAVRVIMLLPLLRERRCRAGIPR